MLLSVPFIPCAGLPHSLASGRLRINHVFLLFLSMPCLSIVTDYLHLFLSVVAQISMVLLLLASNFYFKSIMMTFRVFLNPKSLCPFDFRCLTACTSDFFFNVYCKIPDRSLLREEGRGLVHGSGRGRGDSPSRPENSTAAEAEGAWNVDQEVGSPGKKGGPL